MKLQGAAAGLTGETVLRVIVDTEDKTRAFLPQLDGLIDEGLVILDPVEVIGYIGKGHEQAAHR